MDAATEIWLAEEQASVAARTPLPAKVRSKSPGSSALRLRELEIKEKRAEREIKMRRAEIEAKAEARRAEAEERRMEREAAKAMERLRMEQEVRLRKLELRSSSGASGKPNGRVMGGRRQDNFLVGRTKTFGTLCVTFCRICRPRAPNSQNFLRPSRNCS